MADFLKNNLEIAHSHMQFLTISQKKDDDNRRKKGQHTKLRVYTCSTDGNIVF